MSKDVFEQVADELHGIGRITLIGGEPFQHPALDSLVRTAQVAAGEVEIFTNGLALGSEPLAAGQRILQRIPKADKKWLALVLSVDPTHDQQLPTGRLGAAVEGLLAAEEQGLVRARFSITHPALRTGEYVDTDTISQAIGEVSPHLAKIFMDRLMEGRIQETFYFNSVICTSTLDRVGESEAVRLEDLVFAPEIAISFDHRGQPVVFSSLAAMWAAKPPAAAVLGTLDEADSILRNRLLKRPRSSHSAWNDAWQLATEQDNKQALSRLHRGAESLDMIMQWDSGKTVAAAEAERTIEWLSKGIGDRFTSYGGDEGIGMLDGQKTVRTIKAVLSQPIWRNHLVESTSTWLADLYEHGAARYIGPRELLGKKVPLSPGSSHPLDRIHLPGEQGFSARDELVIRPRLLFFPDGRVSLQMADIQPGSKTSQALDKKDKGLERLLDLLSTVGGKDWVEEIVQLLPTALRHTARHLLPVTLRTIQIPPANDLIIAFSEATFDRNRQRADEDNQELLALVLVVGGDHYPPPAMRKFRSRALTWLERTARLEGRLSDGTQTLLARLNLRGEDKLRLQKLVT
jgi:hypothetical protein